MTKYKEMYETAIVRLADAFGGLQKEIEQKDKEAQKDYDDMRKFQAKYIASDNTVIELRARIAKLEDALRPFSYFACSPLGECACDNCEAARLLNNNEN